jgi:hypothetical protein
MTDRRMPLQDKPADITLQCCECLNSFLWTSGEILYYTSKGLQTPRRCPDCRLRRKLTINPDPTGVRHED